MAADGYWKGHYVLGPDCQDRGANLQSNGNALQNGLGEKYGQGRDERKGQVRILAYVTGFGWHCHWNCQGGWVGQA